MFLFYLFNFDKIVGSQLLENILLLGFPWVVKNHSGMLKLFLILHFLQSGFGELAKI